ncbi:hypothetical protein FQR65_LT20300 [Abscondita terminalis]|nr:hypothetical protein FQR65_LT20300 [Abscondita terminalis]
MGLPQEFLVSNLAKFRIQKETVYSILGSWDFDKDGLPVYTTENGTAWKKLWLPMEERFTALLKTNVRKQVPNYGTLANRLKMKVG